MLKSHEYQKILERRSKKPPPKEEKIDDNKSMTYVLEGILFQDQDHWTVWLNNTPYTPQKNILENNLLIQAKDHTHAEIINGTEVHLIFPGQSYQTQEKRVIQASLSKENT